MHFIQSLNKDFENRVRLGIMSILLVNDWVDFKGLKKLLAVTDGNLASHCAALERNGHIEIKKEFAGKKTKTSYRVTQKGRTAFARHLKALEELINPS